ncbi:MAG: Ig-like domain-containing protein [Syntrophales bacterium LBB04]|nr:Ig-like domain-containing protein [Syntrophales bacterium LBB04]
MLKTSGLRAITFLTVVILLASIPGLSLLTAQPGRHHPGPAQVRGAPGQGLGPGMAFGTDPTRTANNTTVYPYLVSSVPGNNSQHVAITTDILLTFSQSMNTTVTEAALNLTPPAGFTPAWADTNTNLTITFSAPLSYSTTYRLNVTGARDANNVTMNHTIIQFTTEAEPAPHLVVTLSGEVKVYSEQSMVITAHITNEKTGAPVDNATVLGTVFGKGTVTLTLGLTDLAGNLSLTYRPGRVTTASYALINITAARTGFVNGTGQFNASLRTVDIIKTNPVELSGDALGTATIGVAQGETASVQITPVSPVDWPSDKSGTADIYLTVAKTGSGTIIWLNLTVHYRDGILINKGQQWGAYAPAMRMYHWEASGTTWAAVSGSGVDTATQNIWSNSSQPIAGIFAPRDPSFDITKLDYVSGVFEPSGANVTNVSTSIQPRIVFSMDMDMDRTNGSIKVSEYPITVNNYNVKVEFQVSWEDSNIVRLLFTHPLQDETTYLMEVGREATAKTGAHPRGPLQGIFKTGVTPPKIVSYTFGKITDEAGNPITGGNVSLTHDGLVLTPTFDDAGNLVLNTTSDLLSMGTYNLTIKADGYDPVYYRFTVLTNGTIPMNINVPALVKINETTPSNGDDKNKDRNAQISNVVTIILIVVLIIIIVVLLMRRKKKTDALELEEGETVADAVARTCPECAHELGTDEESCPECGTDVPAQTEEGADQGKEPAEEQETEHTCPECKAAVSGSDTTCPECGKNLPKPDSKEDKESPTADQPDAEAPATATMKRKKGTKAAKSQQDTQTKKDTVPAAEKKGSGTGGKHHKKGKSDENK